VTVRYVDGIVDPVDEIARVLRTGDWAANRTDDDVGSALRNSFLVATAWDGERCVGVLRIIGDGVYRALIEDVVVDPAVRGQGIGRALVEFALSRPGVAGVEELILFTNVPAFWGRFGFESAGLAMKRFNTLPFS
jgi:GNAT superfamily N-acetyltransferase